ncbi:MAG: DUF6702 family protein [Bacteroidota bacterium]
MALMFNKWFGLTAFSLFYLISGDFGFSESGTPQRGAGGPHPFHVSVIEINHNATDRTLEISCKIFTDDFEKVLAKNYKTKVDLINPPDKAKMDTLIKKYLYSHLSIKANGRPVQFDYLGFENDHEAAYGYIEVPNIPSVSKFDISTSIMYDLFDDQMNIFHVTVDGKRKSTRLNYPDKDAVVSF